MIGWTMTHLAHPAKSALLTATSNDTSNYFEAVTTNH